MGLAITAALLLTLGAAPLGSPTHVGYVVRYNPGVMEGRAAAHDAPPAPCYVAYTLAHDQDMARLWLQIAGRAGRSGASWSIFPTTARGTGSR